MEGRAFLFLKPRHRTLVGNQKPRSNGLRLIIQKLQRSQFGRRAERLDGDQLLFGFDDLNADIARVPATTKDSQAVEITSLATRPASGSAVTSSSIPVLPPTADIEGVLILRAQGVHSLSVLLVSRKAGFDQAQGERPAQRLS